MKVVFIEDHAPLQKSVGQAIRELGRAVDGARVVMFLSLFNQRRRTIGGWRRLATAGLCGALMAEFVRAVLAQPPAAALAAGVGSVAVGGTLERDLAWTPAMGTMVVTSTLVVPTGLTLTLQAGAQVRLTRAGAIQAVDGGAIRIEGAPARPVVLAPLENGATWQELSARGAASSLTVQQADIAGGRTSVRDGAAGLFEDVYFHDFRLSSCSTLECPILVSSFAESLVVRRCHFREYYETLFRDGVMRIEDSLFELMSGDALDFDGAQPGTVLRRCTFRHGTRAPSNVDAVDIGPSGQNASRGVIIEDCLMYDFPSDKGVSVGDAPRPATGIVVRNCLIDGCRVGVQVKDNSQVAVAHCTLVNNGVGLDSFNKANPSALTGGGHFTNAFDNIVWGNQTAVSLANAGTLAADHSIFENLDWPGEGNLTVDPLFVDGPGHDYRLAPGSPARGAGRDGEDLGAAWPVGAPMAASHPTFRSIRVVAGEVVLSFWADSESVYSVESSLRAAPGTWSVAAEVPPPPRPTLVEVRQPALAGTGVFYRLVASPRERTGGVGFVPEF